MKSEMKKNLGAVLSLAVICSAGFFIFRERYTTNEEIINDKYAQILLNNIPYANERDTEISHSGTYICGNCAVLWYRIEHGKDAKEYYAVECLAENIKEYNYIKEHKAVEGAEGIYYADIESGCYVIIDNENCTGFSGIDLAGNAYEKQLDNVRFPYLAYSQNAAAMEFTLESRGN